ncbi:MAG: efflux RND transporter permease subunit, partial [Planctomycetota bacterium]
MNLAKIAVERPTITTFAVILLTLGGLGAATQLGQLEDPEFTIKTAAVTTVYPGATAEEVELEVTDRLERAIQEMPQVKRIRSRSSPGFSIINVDILSKYDSSKIPQIWDELRRKVNDAAGDLPPGAGKPVVGDDFGDVYGFLVALTGDGFDYAEMETFADALKKELSLVPGVSRVEFWGVPQRCVYIDVSESRLSQLGLTMDDLRATLQQQNLVVDAGGIDFPVNRLRVQPTGTFSSLDDIG